MVNLVSNNDVENLWKKHFLPSLKPLELNLIPDNSHCLDAGSGAGFPGMPIKLMRKDISLDLCESNRKKCLFLRELLTKLRVSGVNVIHNRVEELTGGYDVIFTRAAGKPKFMMELLLPLLNPHGKLLIWTAGIYSPRLLGTEVKAADIENGGRLLIIDND